MTYDSNATYVLFVEQDGVKVFGPNEDTDATAEVVAACKAAETLDDMPTVGSDEAEAVVAAYAAANDIECLDAEFVAVCRVEA